MLDELGLRDLADMVRRFVFSDYGGPSRPATPPDCRDLLMRAGFTGVMQTQYLSHPLSRLIWLWRDLQILSLLDLQRGLISARLETEYRRFILEQIVLLLSHDADLCRGGGGTYLFIAARKPGDHTVRFSDQELADRLMCPRTREPLHRRKTFGAEFLYSAAACEAYPVYRDVPPLIPVYAEIWREQNADRGDDPSGWQPFVYG